MGEGIDLAMLSNPEHARMLSNMRDQLLIIFLHRMGGAVDIPVAEMDRVPERFNFAFSVDIATRMFHFRLLPKPPVDG